jgi:hypothetical protein
LGIFKTILLLLILFLTGCASRAFYVSVDSITSTSTVEQKKKYILLPGNKDCKVNDLQFIEFCSYTDKILQNKGFIKVSNIDEADIAIVLSYGISDPKLHQYTYSIPVWGETGIVSSNTFGTINKFINAMNYSQTTSYTPRYGVVGYSTHVGTKILFVRYLTLSGADLEKFKKTGQIQDIQELWSTKAHSIGESGDLREIFPVLLIASQKHIAENTGKQVSYELEDNRRLEKQLNELKH